MGSKHLFVRLVLSIALASTAFLVAFQFTRSLPVDSSAFESYNSGDSPSESSIVQEQPEYSAAEAPPAINISDAGDSNFRPDQYSEYVFRAVNVTLLPPPLFSDWISFASEKGCFVDLRFYKQIYRDLLPFFNDNSGFKDIETAPNVNLAKLNLGDEHNRFEGAQDSVFGPLGDLFDKPFTLALNNMYDEPQIIPADSELVEYASNEDIFAHSSCIRNVHDTPSNENRINETTMRHMHGFFMVPDTFIARNSKTPVFSQCKTECFWDIVIPMNNHPDLAGQGFSRDPYSWQDKADVLFWRGSATGGRFSKEVPWRKYHRIRLMQWVAEFAQRYPKNMFDSGKSAPPRLPVRKGSQSLDWLAVDVGFHHVGVRGKDVEQQIIDEYPLRSYVSFEDCLKFKYLLVIDGNTWPSRTPRYLTSNSVILLSTAFTDWYMWMLEPFVHYVPVKLDLSDLDDKLRWLRDNDDAARQISENANKLMDRINRLEQMQCYAGLAMIEYSRIYENFKKGIVRTAADGILSGKSQHR
ncbi:capsule-associated protein CAP1 [Entophlyctis sp. JEL0112]|nr:capsule-associated protein CAP1 [Entophlyctis sp. JEL0112]